MKKIVPMVLLSLCVAMPAMANMDKNKTGRSESPWFNKIDSNSDGVISQSENEVFARKMFNEADSNNDNKVTKDEMRAQKHKDRAEMGYNRDRDYDRSARNDGYYEGRMSPAAGQGSAAGPVSSYVGTPKGNEQ